MPARDLALIAVFAGLTAALSLTPAFPNPFSPAPITAQSLAVVLAGAILGPWRGALSQLLFLTLAALGLPILSGGRGGIGVFFGPTVGFLVGFVVTAAVIGALTYRFGAPYRLVIGIVINTAISLSVMYVCGIFGLVLRTQMTLSAAALSMVPFLIGDTLKAVVAAVVAKGVHSAFPGLLPYHGKTNQDKHEQISNTELAE